MARSASPVVKAQSEADRVFADSIFVHPEGSDMSGDGTREKPWGSFRAAVQQARGQLHAGQGVAAIVMLEPTIASLARF